MIQIISVTTRIGLIMVLGMKSRKKDMHQLIYGNVLILSNTPSVLRNRKGNPHSPDCYHWQLHVLTNEIRLYADRKTNGWEEANPKNITPPFLLIMIQLYSQNCVICFLSIPLHGRVLPWYQRGKTFVEQGGSKARHRKTHWEKLGKLFSFPSR